MKRPVSLVSYPAIQFGRRGAVEVHSGDGRVVGNDSAKLLTTKLSGSIAESALPARRHWCSTSQSATPWDRSAASRLSYDAFGSKPKSSLVIGRTHFVDWHSTGVPPAKGRSGRSRGSAPWHRRRRSAGIPAEAVRSSWACPSLVEMVAVSLPMRAACILKDWRYCSPQGFVATP